MDTSTWLLFGIAVILLVWMFFTYNGLVALRQRCRQAFADIDVQLKQRHDLIPNLVEAVKGYVGHEKGVLEEVVKLRNAAANAHGPAAQGPAEAQLSSALRQLLVVVEGYPELKASENFKALQSELSDVENKIAAARRFFNSAASEYNASRESIPAVLFSNAMGFAAQDFFVLDDTERQAASVTPKVQF